MGKRVSYTDEDKAAALAMLDANDGNVKGTADSLGIPESTLRSWKNDRGTPRNIAELRDKNRGELSDRIFNLTHLVLDNLPEKLDEASAKDLFVSLGILVDKLQLLKGQPTNHSRVSGTGPKGAIPIAFTPFEDMSDDELDAFIAENSE